ncbi:MAG: prolyl oligopeptidase family serine peptidase [Myxococcaceae bacterium]
MHLGLTSLLGLAALGVQLAPLAADAQAAPPLTVERIVSRAPSLFGTAPTAPQWSPDGQQLGFLWNDQAMPARDVWLVEREGSAPRRLTHAGDGGAGGVSEFVWAPGGAVLYLAGGEIRRIAATGGTDQLLAQKGGERSGLSMSPDGTTLAFLQEGDLWLMPLVSGAPVQATHVGVKPIGKIPLGVYYHPDVEIGSADWGQNGAAYAWSADSKFVAAHYVDRRSVRRFPIPYYLTPDAILNELRRGSPGDVNELRTVGILEVSTREFRLLELPNPSGSHIVGFAWSPKGPLLIDRETDNCVDRTLTLFDPKGWALREVWTDHRESRIFNDVASAWHPDGVRILLTGDLDDRYRLYLLTPGETPPKQLTFGPYDVDGAAIAESGWPVIYYVSTEPRPEERQVWRIPAQGGKADRISTLPGTNTPFVSPDGKVVALLHSDDRTPTELYLGDRRITHSPPPEFSRTTWANVRYASFPGSTAGVDLHARILEPPHLDRTKRYPVIFGPVYSNTVRNRWVARWEGLMQLLVQRGYILVQVDSRGSTGYGRAFREKFLSEWGSSDLDDYQDAVRYMKSLPYVDGQRIGIFGSSYGGLITIFALFKEPGLFAAGVAAAPATDPHYFGSDDVAHSRTPETNPELFDKGRAVLYAKNLRDHLLIIHGMADDVVPFQTSVMLTEELIRQHKDFDFAFSPTATHAWAARPDDAIYLFGRLIAHFDRWLGPGARPATGSRN